MSLKIALEQLKEQQSLLAKEDFNLALDINIFSNIMDSIRNVLSLSNKELSKQEVITFNKDQNKLLNVIKRVQYASLRELLAYVPEGMIKTYLEYLSMLESNISRCVLAHQKVINPFHAYLSHMAVNNKDVISINSAEVTLVKFEAERERKYSEFSTLYMPNSVNTKVCIKNVIDRNEDWLKVFTNLNRCISDLEQIDLVKIKEEISHSLQLINIIQDTYTKNKESYTPEIILNLSEYVYQVAREIEYISYIYYKGLSIRGATENTVKNVLRIYD